MRHVFRYLVASTPRAGQEVALSADDSHHLARVVRRGPGDAVELIDPEGARWAAVVVSTGPPGHGARRRRSSPPPASAAPVALYLGLAEWGRLDTAVEKAVELGAGEVTLFVSERAGRVPEAGAWEPPPRAARARGAGRRAPERTGPAGPGAGAGTVRGSDHRDPGRGGVPDRPTRRRTAAPSARRRGRSGRAYRRGRRPPGGLLRGRGRPRPGGRACRSARSARRSCAPRPRPSPPWPSPARRGRRGERLPLLPHRGRRDPGVDRAPRRPFVAFADIAPKAPVHLLVIPARHVDSIAGVAGLDERRAGGACCTFIAEVAREAGLEEARLPGDDQPRRRRAPERVAPALAHHGRGPAIRDACERRPAASAWSRSSSSTTASPWSWRASTTGCCAPWRSASTSRSPCAATG